MWTIGVIFVHVRYMLTPVRLSVRLSVCNARAPYSAGWNFGKLNATRVAKYSDFVPIKGYISETVQDRR